MSHKCEECKYCVGAKGIDKHKPMTWECSFTRTVDVDPVTQNRTVTLPKCTAFRKAYWIIAMFLGECGRTARYFSPKAKPGETNEL